MISSREKIVISFFFLFSLKKAYPGNSALEAGLLKEIRYVKKHEEY